MDTLGQLIDRRPAVPAESLCETALAAFIHDNDCRVLAVVEGDEPVGVVCRDSFLARMEIPGAAERPIREIMDVDLLIADEGETAPDFVARARRTQPMALQSGFVVTQGGVYAGVCDLLRLLDPLVRLRPDAGLIDGICAEMREPVAHALAAVEGLRRMRLPDGAASHLDTIADAGRATLSLLDVAAELQQAAAGRLQVVLEPRRLQELMDDLEARWREQAEAAGATLLVSYDGQPDCAAMIDHGRLLQVFDAMIGHALAQSGRGVIEASLQARAGEAGVALTARVRDNGAFYAPGYLAAMFKGGPEARIAGGIGIQLGLMLAERSIAAMGGSLEVQANTGPGATMSFGFNADLADRAEADGDRAQSNGPGRPAHVLVVDDNATNRMVVEALCEMFDCSTESVVDGVEAVEAARAGRFDVILMDIKMPRMDGVTAAREIRKLPAPAGRVPIIALTANADPDEVAEYLAAGMRAVVEKPIKPERLMEALEAALAEAAQQDAMLPGAAAA